MRTKADQFQQVGANVVLVGLGTPEETADFRTRFHVPFPMIADPQKKLFTTFQLKQAATGSLFSVGMAVKGLAALANGHGMGIPKGDVRQLPGVFIIDTDGHIRFSHYSEDPADHPDPETLLANLRDED